MLKYSTGASSSLQPNEQPTDQTDTDAFTDADSDTEQGEAQQSEKLDEISIDDLPSKMSLIMDKIEASTAELNIGTQILDQIIMDAVAEGLAGDPDELPVMQETNQDDKEDTHSSSTSSSSEQFVMLSSGASSGNSSDQVMVDSPPKKQTASAKDDLDVASSVDTDTTITEGCISPMEVIV